MSKRPMERAACQSVNRVVTRLRSEGVGIETLYTELFAPSLHRVGELWTTGDISIAEEHVATALVEQLMAALYPELFVAGRASREGRVLVAAPAGERHVVGLRMFSDILEGRGFELSFLGADVTRADLAHALEEHIPDLVVLAAYTARPAAELAAAATMLLGLEPRLFVVAGGASDAIRDVVDTQDERIAIVDTIADALLCVEQVLASRAERYLSQCQAA